jgi:hypothetical protein
VKQKWLWLALEDRVEWLSFLDARIIEKVHAAILRLWALEVEHDDQKHRSRSNSVNSDNQGSQSSQGTDEKETSAEGSIKNAIIRQYAPQ